MPRTCQAGHPPVATVFTSASARGAWLVARGACRQDEVIAVIQLINKLSGLSFNRTDEELVAAFCSQVVLIC